MARDDNTSKVQQKMKLIFCQARSIIDVLLDQNFVHLVFSAPPSAMSVRLALTWRAIITIYITVSVVSDLLWLKSNSSDILARFLLNLISCAFVKTAVVISRFLGRPAILPSLFPEISD
jgi:hypothetical protein